MVVVEGERHVPAVEVGSHFFRFGEDWLDQAFGGEVEQFRFLLEVCDCLTVRMEVLCLE